MKRVNAGGCLLMVTALGLQAEPLPITDEDVAEINADVAVEASAHEKVETAIDEYFASKGIVESVLGKGGKVYYRAIETVGAKPSSPAWAKSRQIAFERALLQAQADFVFDTFGRAVVEAESNLQENNSSNADEFEEKLVSRSRVESLVDKTLALSDARVSELLSDAGADPNEYDAVPEAERKDIYVNNFIKKSLSKAMGLSSGLLPVQTFEGTDGRGGHAVGVVMLRSDKLQQLASDMSRQREPFMTSTKGKPIATYLEYPAERMANQFGIRVVFDERGKPVVLSFGQWGFGYKGNNDAVLTRRRNSAGEQADIVAIEALTEFMNSRLSLETESERGELTEQFVIKQGDEIREDEIYVLVDQLWKQVKRKSSARLSGSRVVKRWAYKHPYGHEIVGRVRMWSMAGVDAANDVANFKPDRVRRQTRVLAEDPEPQAVGVKAGISYDEAEEAF